MKQALYLSAALATLGAGALLAVAGPVAAQSPPQSPPQSPAQSPPQSAQSQAAPQREDEVVVTARKREETLTDVPAAGSALNAQALEQLQIRSIDDLTRVIPGAVSNGNGPEFLRSISIRGAGAGRSAESNSAVGLFKNGIFNAGGFFGGRSFTRGDLFDVERVESLRGPQGGLYGRNAIGGAINVVTARPRDERSFTALLGASSWNTFNGEAVFNAPLGGGWALRAGAYGETGDGYVENVSVGGPAYGEIESHGARVTARGPFLGPLTLTAILEAQRTQSPSFSGVAANIANPTLGRDQRIANTPSSSDVREIAATVEMTADFGTTRLTSITQVRERQGSTRDDLDAFQCAFGDGDGWSATSPQGVREPGANPCGSGGAAGLPANLVGGLTPNATQSREGRFQRWSQEVRLEGQATAAVRWLVGADILYDATSRSAAIWDRPTAPTSRPGPIPTSRPMRTP